MWITTRYMACTTAAMERGLMKESLKLLIKIQIIMGGRKTVNIDWFHKTGYECDLEIAKE